VVVSGALVAFGAAAAGDGSARTLADYPLSGFDGKKVTLSSYRGDVVVVSFWASWCAPCRKELPVLDVWSAQWAGHGARVVAISIDTLARRARNFADEQNLTMPLFHDGPTGLARQLDLPSLPCTYVLDARGNVVAVIQSGSPEQLDTIRHTVEALMIETGAQPVLGAGMESTAEATSPLQQDNRGNGSTR
jgi:peroxiredoxin